MSLLARLIEVGTPADLVAEVAEELARAKVSQEAIESRRAKDRERQQRRRDAEGGNVMSRDVADVTECHEATPLSPSPKDNNSNPHPHTPVNNTPVRERRLGLVAKRERDWPEIPAWIPAEPWNGFVEMRRKNRKYPTGRAVKSILDKLERWRASGHDPGDVLDRATEGSWTTIYEPKDDKNDYRKPTGTATAAQRAIASLGG